MTTTESSYTQLNLSWIRMTENLNRHVYTWMLVCRIISCTYSKRIFILLYISILIIHLFFLFLIQYSQNDSFAESLYFRLGAICNWTCGVHVCRTSKSRWFITLPHWLSWASPGFQTTSVSGPLWWQFMTLLTYCWRSVLYSHQCECVR